MSSNGNRERVGHYLACSFLIFVPCHQRKSYPDWAPINQELYVDGIGMARGNGDYQGLINAMDLLLGPAIKGMEIAIHGSKTISIVAEKPQFASAKCKIFPGYIFADSIANWRAARNSATGSPVGRNSMAAMRLYLSSANLRKIFL